MIWIYLGSYPLTNDNVNDRVVFILPNKTPLFEKTLGLEIQEHIYTLRPLWI